MWYVNFFVCNEKEKNISQRLYLKIEQYILIQLPNMYYPKLTEIAWHESSDYVNVWICCQLWQL